MPEFDYNAALAEPALVWAFRALAAAGLKPREVIFRWPDSSPLRSGWRFDGGYEFSPPQHFGWPLPALPAGYTDCGEETLEDILGLAAPLREADLDETDNLEQALGDLLGFHVRFKEWSDPYHGLSSATFTVGRAKRKAGHA